MSCLFTNIKGKEIEIPRNTYPGVPASIIHAGGRVRFTGVWEKSIYRLWPEDITDSALRFRRGMYEGGLWCCSFHAGKQLPIGRGGAILCDDAAAVRWLKLARFDGREECPLSEQKEFSVLGFNAYMQPEQAARGLMLFDAIKDRDIPDLKVENQGYGTLDLARWQIFTGTRG